MPVVVAVYIADVCHYHVFVVVVIIVAVVVFIETFLLLVKLIMVYQYTGTTWVVPGRLPGSRRRNKELFFVIVAEQALQFHIAKFHVSEKI